MQTIRIRQRLDAFTLDVDLSLPRRVTGLFGPSGSGKTTLLNCIAGLIAPPCGFVRVGDVVVYARGDGRDGVNVRVRDRRIGYVFQDPLLFEHMTVEGNLRYSRRAGDGPGFSQVVDVLELGGLLARRAHALSGGEKRRVAIGRALLSSPRLLLLDEPLTGLDRRLAGRTLAYIRAVLDAFDLPAIYVSHLVSDVIYLCDEVVVLDRGAVVAQGAPAELIAWMESADPQHRPGLKNIFTAPVAAVDASAGTVTCLIGAQMLVIAGRADVGAQRVTAIAPAGDIILAKREPAGLSARNVLRGKVERVEPLAGGCVVFVDVGHTWMVEVTAGAVRELGICPGASIYVIIKASSMQIIDDCPNTR